MIGQMAVEKLVANLRCRICGSKGYYTWQSDPHQYPNCRLVFASLFCEDPQHNVTHASYTLDVKTREWRRYR